MKSGISLRYRIDIAPPQSAVVTEVLGTPKAVQIVMYRVLVPARATDAHADRSNKGWIARENDIA